MSVSGFLLLVFTAGVHLSLDPLTFFAHEGGQVQFSAATLVNTLMDHGVLYRVLDHGDELLVNCLQTMRQPPDGYNIECIDKFLFKLNNLTMFNSGDYRAEHWREGHIAEQRIIRLTVCREHDENPSQVTAAFDESAVLCRLDTTLLGGSLQLYRYKGRNLFLSFEVSFGNILVLDTNSSLEPLAEDLKGRLQVDLENSLVTLSGI